MPESHFILPSAVTGVVLAGGRATRMGGVDKGLVALGDRPMVQHVLDTLRPQVKEVIINANRNRAEYESFGARVIADEVPGFNGPLAGMASAMAAVDSEFIITAPCDSPFLPADLVERLCGSMVAKGAEICVAHDGNRMQPVFSLMGVGLRDSVLEFLERGERKIDRWFASHRTVTVDFSDRPAAFLNANTPEDLQRMENELGGRQRAAR